MHGDDRRQSYARAVFAWLEVYGGAIGKMPLPATWGLTEAEGDSVIWQCIGGDLIGGASPPDKEALWWGIESFITHHRAAGEAN